MIADKIEYKIPKPSDITEETTMRLQSLARNSRLHSFAETRRKNQVDYAFHTDKPAEIQNARRTYNQHIRHGAMVVAHLTGRDYFHPVGYALAMPASETPIAELFRIVSGKPAVAVLGEVNIMAEYQDHDFLPEELATQALQKFERGFKNQALASPEDTLMQTALHGLGYEIDPPSQQPRKTYAMFGSDAPPVDLYLYSQRRI